MYACYFFLFQHCFEIYAPGGAIIKACKTESDGKVVTGIKAIFIYFYIVAISDKTYGKKGNFPSKFDNHKKFVSALT